MKRGITLASLVLMASALLAPADLGAQTRDETVIYAPQSDVQNWDPPNSVLRVQFDQVDLRRDLAPHSRLWL